MNVSIMQPAYLPWLGYFDRLAQSDLHIVLDHVLIDLNSHTKFANRNKIRTQAGWMWLTVPIKTKGLRDQLFLNTIEIVEGNDWARKHWNAIKASYSRAPFFKDHVDFFEDAYARPWKLLHELARHTTSYLSRALGLETKTVSSSTMGIASHKDELILDLCRTVGATTYISGPFGREYLRESLFTEAGIRVKYHDYPHPNYPQVFSGFEPFVSAVDLLFNCGPRSLSILTGKEFA